MYFTHYDACNQLTKNYYTTKEFWFKIRIFWAIEHLIYTTGIKFSLQMMYRISKLSILEMTLPDLNVQSQKGCCVYILTLPTRIVKLNFVTNCWEQLSVIWYRRSFLRLSMNVKVGGSFSQCRLWLMFASAFIKKKKKSAESRGKNFYLATNSYSRRITFNNLLCLIYHHLHLEISLWMTLLLCY